MVGISMDEEEILQLLKEFKNSQYFKSSLVREERRKYNYEWVKPEKLKIMQTKILRVLDVVATLSGR
ncbi:MAG: hypothetical protein ACPLYF_01755 [Fervidobacterium sp.]